MELSTTDKKSFIIGMTLGDGYISRGKNAVHYNISCTHNPAQYDYLIWKMDILKKNLSRNYWISEKRTKFTGKGQYKGNAGKQYQMYMARLGTHPLVSKIYNEVYINKVKYVSKEVLQQLTPIGLSVWYMDDGNLAYRKNSNGSIKSRNVTLHIQGFDKQSQLNIVQYFQESWGIESRLHKSRDKYKLWMNTPNSIKFLKIVAPYVNMVECMRYKIDLKYEKRSVELFNQDVNLR
jgi:DNA-binding transcriptional regulator WhiA